jgi:hypothetical protein
MIIVGIATGWVLLSIGTGLVIGRFMNIVRTKERIALGRDHDVDRPVTHGEAEVLLRR